MHRHQETSPRNLRYLTAADGYLQLGLPERALAELDAIDGDEELEAPIAYLRGEALKAQERYDDAIGPLQRAARLIPAPFNRQVWQSLVDCLRQGDHDDLAAVVEMVAEAQAEDESPLQLEIEINIRLEPESDEDPDADQSDFSSPDEN